MMAHDPGMTSDERALGGRVDAAAWGVFFVWVGIALLAHVGWGVGLIGVGVITIGAQAWRKHVGVSVERFSVIIGVFFVIAGIWSLFGLRVDVVPLLLIVAGCGLLLSTWRTRPAPGGNPPAHP